MVNRRNPGISVIIAVRDPDPQFYALALRSLVDQSRSDLEILVVEAGSSPGLEVADRLGDERVRRLSVETPSLIAQRNLGLTSATAEFVAFMGCDDIAACERLERQLEFLERHPEVDVVGSNLVIIDGGGRVIGSRSYPASHEAIMKRMPRANAIADPSVVARRRVLVDGGGMRYDRFGGMGEDYELWSRLARNGVRFANMDQYLTFYRMHPGSTKAQRTCDHLKATLDIKRTYWRDRMNSVDRLRFAAEMLMTLLPPALVYSAFGLSHGKPPEGVSEFVGSPTEGRLE